jgi:nitrile hydratase accessory protein
MNAAIPGTSGLTDVPVFAEPWQAHAFALTLALHERGLFSWPEWASALAAEIEAAQAAGDPDRGDTYYRHWLVALERLVAAKGASSADELARTRDAWDQAAGRTPHGQPIELRPDDFVPAAPRRRDHGT